MIAPWLEVALHELVAGVREVPGEEHSARIVEYQQATTLQAQDDETPWCAAFVNWALRETHTMGTESSMARSFLDWGQSVEPRVGAVAVLWRNRPDSRAGHVGFYLDASPHAVYLLGGNQSNRVSVQGYPVGRLLGCRWPGDAPVLPA